MFRIGMAFVLGSLAIASSAWAQSYANFDPATGKQEVEYPTSRSANFKHMRLDLSIADMNTPHADAVQHLRFAPLIYPVTEIALDAKALAIHTVGLDGAAGSAARPASAVKFSHDGRTLRVTFDPPLPPGQDYVLVTTYSIDDPPLGLTWMPESPSHPGRAAQIYSQGEPQTNSYWFPCHDFPNLRLTTEISVTVPRGYEVASNGHLVSRKNALMPVKSLDARGGAVGERTLKAFETWHWLQDKPHVNYLVTLIVGKFDVLDLGTKQLPMPVYAPQGRMNDIRPTFGRTPQMIKHFSTLLDEPYPWDRYAQLLVWNFGNGGMENTSATTLIHSAIVPAEHIEDHDQDGLISHELAHQWFGDLITCNSWKDLWLNEGFATYMTALWFEHRDGAQAYQEQVQGNFDGILGGDKPDAPAVVGMASNVYLHPWEAFRRPANPYGKGASILHMLRRRLGDAVFFRGLARYIDARKFTTVETADFRTTLEAVSGESLESFFDQWCFRPGTPALTITPIWSADTHTLALTIDQAQAINGANPAFELSVPIVLVASDGTARQSHTIALTGRTTKSEFPFSSEPLMIIIDPEQTQLAAYTVVQPASRWLMQLAHGPTLSSRVQAARALGKADSSFGSTSNTEVLGTLRSLAADRSSPKWLRREAIAAIAARKGVSDLEALAAQALDHWELRRAIIDGLVEAMPGADDTASNERIADIIAGFASQDRTLSVRASAIRAAGRLKNPRLAALVRKAVNTESFNDDLRHAALDALATLDDAQDLQAVIECTASTFDSRTRPVAIATLGKLAHHDQDRAVHALIPLLTDHEYRTARAAGDALASIRDPMAIPAIEELIKQSRSDDAAWQGGQWLKALRKPAP